jgi:hypothetical protein
MKIWRAHLCIGFILACFLVSGCASPSIVIDNQTASPIQMEVRLGTSAYFRVFSRDQNFRFRLREGERWDSQQADDNHRVQWRAAQGVHTGVLIRTHEMADGEAEVFSLSPFKRGHLLIRGEWPELELVGHDESGEAIQIRAIQSRLE